MFCEQKEMMIKHYFELRSITRRSSDGQKILFHGFQLKYLSIWFTFNIICNCNWIKWIMQGRNIFNQRTELLCNKWSFPLITAPNFSSILFVLWYFIWTDQQTYRADFLSESKSWKLPGMSKLSEKDPKTHFFKFYFNNLQLYVFFCVGHTIPR